MIPNWLLKAHIQYQSKRCKDAYTCAYQQALLPLLNLPIKQAPLLVLDLEMTGLDPKQDQIISMGIMPILNGQIKLDKGQHKLIKIAGSVGQSATIHGLVDADLTDALTLDNALQWLLKEATGSILVAHHAPLDMRFIEQALCNRSENNDKLGHLYAIDTLRIEQQRLLRKQPLIKDGELRLARCRQRYNLPHYDAHNALVDALSCAELLLAQMSKMGGSGRIKVVELIS